MLISNVVYIVAGLIGGTLHLSSIVMCIYYIILIIAGKNAITESDSQTL